MDTLVVMTENMTIPAGEDIGAMIILIVPGGRSLTVADGGSLSSGVENYGTITVMPGGKLATTMGGNIWNRNSLTVSEGAELKSQMGGSVVNCAGSELTIDGTFYCGCIGIGGSDGCWFENDGILDGEGVIILHNVAEVNDMTALAQSVATMIAGGTTTPTIRTQTEHTFGEWTRAKDPTESENGEDIRTCVICSMDETRVIPAHGSGLVMDEEGTIRFYDNGEPQYAGVVCSDGVYFYVNSAKQAVRSCSYYITKTNGLLPAGQYYIGADGHIEINFIGDNLILRPDGDIFYFENGEAQYAGVVQGYDGSFYYVNSTKKAVKNTVYNITRTNGLLPAGQYSIGADGRIVVNFIGDNLIMSPDGDIICFENGEAQYAGVVQSYDGSFYYINSTKKAVKNCSYYITKTNSLLPAGQYNIGADGRIAVTFIGENLIKSGDGTIICYVNGEAQYAGVVRDSLGNYYYINSTRQAVRNTNYFITKTNGLIPVWSYTIDANGVIQIPVSNYAALAETERFCYKYAGLSAEQKELYNVIKTAVINRTAKINFNTYPTIEDVALVFQCVTDDYPEIYWVDTTNYNYSYNSTGKCTSLTLSYISDGDPALLAAAVDGFRASLPAGLSEYELELRAHDFICGATVYDYDTAYNGSTANPHAHNAYGALVSNYCVCEGYSRAMELLLNSVGIECSLVRGNGNGEPHMWNQVKIDGEWYNLDVTWDDPLSIPDNAPVKYFHAFLNNTDGEFTASNHDPYPVFASITDPATVTAFNAAIMTCTSTGMDFYAHTSAELTSAETDQEIISAAVLAADAAGLNYCELHASGTSALAADAGGIAQMVFNAFHRGLSVGYIQPNGTTGKYLIYWTFNS